MGFFRHLNTDPPGIYREGFRGPGGSIYDIRFEVSV